MEIISKKRHTKWLGALLATVGFISTAYAKPDCSTVRFSNVGWVDITATTNTASELLEDLGYQTQTQMLSIPVTCRALANKNIDVFLGDWMPVMADDIAKYLKNGSIDIIGTNLTGAKFTLAVPQYVYDAGVHSMSDLSKYADKFHRSIYGIEPGNSGNRLIREMLKTKKYGLDKFRLIASSEAGMLSQLRRMTRRHQWIVFLGWEPHPMNTNFKIKYLSGGEEFFGPNYGNARVLTNVRHGYTKQCPNVGHLLKNLHFTLAMENELMDKIINGHQQPRKAAKTYLKQHPQLLTQWLDGVKTRQGQPGLPVVKAALGLQ